MTCSRYQKIPHPEPPNNITMEKEAIPQLRQMTSPVKVNGSLFERCLVDC